MVTKLVYTNNIFIISTIFQPITTTLIYYKIWMLQLELALIVSILHNTKNTSKINHHNYLRLHYVITIYIHKLII